MNLVQCNVSNEDFLKNIITGSEMLIYGYDPETMAKSLVWKSPSQLKKAHQVHKKMKVMITFFSITTVVHNTSSLQTVKQSLSQSKLYLHNMSPL